MDSKDYFEYVQQIIDSGNIIAIHVKMNDLHHNIARGKAFGYPDLVAKHEKALQMIEDFLQKQKKPRLSHNLKQHRRNFAVEIKVKLMNSYCYEGKEAFFQRMSSCWPSVS